MASLDTRSWCQQKRWIISSLALLPPLGIALVWLTRNWSKSEKIAAKAVLAILLLSNVASCSTNSSSQPVVTNPPSVSTPESSANQPSPAVRSIVKIKGLDFKDEFAAEAQETSDEILVSYNTENECTDEPGGKFEGAKTTGQRQLVFNLKTKAWFKKYREVTACGVSVDQGWRSSAEEESQFTLEENETGKIIRADALDDNGSLPIKDAVYITLSGLSPTDTPAAVSTTSQAHVPISSSANKADSTLVDKPISKKTESSPFSQRATLTTQDSGSRINVRDDASVRAFPRHYGFASDAVLILSRKQGDDGDIWYQVKFVQSEAKGWVNSKFVLPAN